MALALAETEEEIAACFPALLELRPHLKKDEFVAQVRRQESEGFLLAYALDEQGMFADSCGFRQEIRLFTGRIMYTDDLIPRADARDKSYGGALSD